MLVAGGAACTRASHLAASAVLVPLVGLAAGLVVAPPPGTRLRAVGVAGVVTALGAAVVATLAAVA